MEEHDIAIECLNVVMYIALKRKSCSCRSPSSLWVRSYVLIIMLSYPLLNRVSYLPVVWHLLHVQVLPTYIAHDSLLL